MSTREWKKILAGVLLPAPLIVLAVYGMQGVMRKPSSGEARLSPVLSNEDRLKLKTYQRPCKKGEECEAPLACLPHPGLFKAYCTDSECVTDAQCQEGYSCQVLQSWDNGLGIRKCIPLGIRKEGERCVSIPASQDEACWPGLLCGLDWCGRPCKKGVPGTCPEGFFCADVTPGPLCLPACELSGCPEGQECIRFNQGVSACAVVHGGNCQQTGCLSGQTCERLDREDRPREVWMQCVTPCGKEGHPSCPQGLICEYFSCKKPCDPEALDDCGPGYRCGRFRPERPWVCMFDQRKSGPRAGTR